MLRAGSMALLLMLVVAACGGDTDGVAQDEPAPPADDDTADDGDGAPDPEPAADPDPDTAPEDEEGALVLDGELIASADLYERAQAEGPLIMYSGRAEPTELAILGRYTEDTGLPVTNVALPAGQLFERILTEWGAGQLEADVIRLSDMTYFSTMKEEGILDPHTVPMWDLIPDEYKDPEGYFYAATTPMVIIGYNEARISAEDAPKSWAELLDPQYRGMIGHPPAGAGGQTWSWTLFQLLEFGKDYWEEMAAQDTIIYPSGAVMTQDLVRGEIPIGITALPTVATQIADGAPLGFHFPEDGIPLFAQSLGKAATAQNPAAAEVFINWSMSVAGAAAGAELTTEHHGHPDAPPPSVGGQPIPPLSELPRTFLADPETWARDRDAHIEEWNRIFGFTG